MASQSMMFPDIPEKFAGYADILKKTMKKTVKFELNNNAHLKKWQSKVGGIPYLPLEEKYPLNSDENPLLFLAQVNFSEIPHIEGFPKEGIVEFYIDGDDELMGLDSNGFKVLYFKDIIEIDSDLQDVNMHSHPVSPFESNASYSMNFSLQNQYISTCDYRFEDLIELENDYDLYDEYSLLYPSNGHRIGGYPYFTQQDPRSSEGNFKDYELLFQLDSDKDILWGDMGVGSFFIKPDDLIELNFSNVLYNWDCC